MKDDKHTLTQSLSHTPQDTSIHKLSSYAHNLNSPQTF